MYACDNKYPIDITGYIDTKANYKYNYKIKIKKENYI